MEQLSSISIGLFIAEIVLLAIIIGIQINSAIRTKRKVIRFADFFPKNPGFIEQQTISEIEVKEPSDGEKIKLLNKSSGVTGEYHDTVSYINSYLLSCTNQAPEYSEIKELTEKTSESADENINVTLFSPLYLGLMGTILGIIFGVLGFVVESYMSSDKTKPEQENQTENVNSINGRSDSETAIYSDNSITTEDENNILWPKKESNNGDLKRITWLLVGVGIAMMASFIGLFLSLVNSSHYYRKAKLKHDKYKFNFLNKIRLELIPAYQFKDTSTIPSLHRAINKFNRNLTSNIKKLGDYNRINLESVALQKNLIDKIDGFKLEAMISNNIHLLESFTGNINHLEKLNSSLNNVNQFVSESSTLSIEANRLFGRFKNFETNSQKIFDEINSRLKVSEKLLDFLDSHFTELQQRGALIINAVGDVDETIKSSINELNANNRTTLSNYTRNVGEIDSALVQSVEEIREHLSQQLNILIQQTENQADFVGKGYEIAIQKYDETLQNLSKEITSKISKLNTIASEETLRIEAVIGENRESLSKLNRLDDIKALLDDFKLNNKNIDQKLDNVEIQLSNISKHWQEVNREKSKPDLQQQTIPKSEEPMPEPKLESKVESKPEEPKPEESKSEEPRLEEPEPKQPKPEPKGSLKWIWNKLSGKH